MEALSPILIHDTPVWVEGQGTQTLLMLHGWPDTHELWDAAVAHLKTSYRCVRLTLPGFDVSLPERLTSLDAMCEHLRSVVDAVSPQVPVILVLHDWGCVFGYEFAARYPDKVSRIAAVDIGDHNSATFAKSLPGKARWQIFSYQFWLALAWFIGKHLSSALGDRMTRGMANALRCPTPSTRIGWQQNYPYAMQWFGLAGGFKHAAKVQPDCPVLYLYGERKPFQFHSKGWLDRIRNQPGSVVQAFATGHWVMCQQPDLFNTSLRSWLDRLNLTTTTDSDLHAS